MVLVTVETLIQGITRTFTLYGSRNLVFVLILIIYVGEAPSQHKELKQLQAPNELGACSLTVGWGIWPPYQYLSEKNQPVGIQIELLNTIAAEAQCSLNYVQQPFSQNVSDIRDGKIDLMADTTVTDQREKFAYFSDAYRHEILLLYVNKDQISSCKGRSLDELLSQNFRLGLTEGNLYGNEVLAIEKNQIYSNKIVYLKENRDGVTALINGDIDGFFEDPIVLSYELKRRKLLGQVISCRIEVYAGDVSLMFSRKTVSHEIVERFNRALVKIKQSAEYQSNWEW